MSAIYYARNYLAIFILLQAHCMVTPLRLKIAMERKIGSDAISSITKRSAGACYDYYQVDPTKISFSQNPKPWDRPPAMTFASESVTQGMKQAFMKRVPGLGKTTIKNVFDTFMQHGCICLPFGGSVRDQFLGRDALDIDADTPCDLDVIVDICKKYWDAKYCKAPPKSAVMQIVHVGELDDADEEEIDLANWNKTFFGELTNLEYTTNSLAYYYDGKNTSVVVDLTGTGVEDTCNKTIKIPVPRDQWDAWYNDDTYKIFRYWKLRAKGYSAVDNTLSLFIKNTTKNILSTVFGIKSFKKTFCKYAFDGYYCSGRKTCTLPHPECTDRNLESRKRGEYYTLYQKDLNEFWEEEAKEMLEEVKIECPYGVSNGSKTNLSLTLIIIGIAVQAIIDI